MALPTSGTLRLSDVIAEFGGGNSLRDFFRGGAYVPNTPANAGVPTSGTIQLRDLLGAAAVTPAVNIANHLIEGYSPGEFGSSRATYTLDSNGTAKGNGSGSGGTSATYSGEWLVEGSASMFEVRVTSTNSSGMSGSSSPLGTWLSLSTLRAWTLERSTLGTSTATLTVQIRLASSGTVLDSATITLNVYH